MINAIPFIGIDAAFSNTGIVLGEYDLLTRKPAMRELRLVTTEADKAGKKVVRKNSDDVRRAREIVRGLQGAIEDHKPKFAFVEVPMGAQSARAAWSLGIAVGIIAMVAEQVSLIQVTPKEVKEVVGIPHADKAEMIAWAHNAYPGVNWPVRGGKVIAGKAEHLADAIAAVHAGIKTDEFQRTVSMLSVLR